MEGAMAVRVTAAHTAEARAEAGREAGEGGVAAAAALSSGGFLGLPAPFSEEDEDDVHRCGRCQVEFTALEDFVQHKIQKTCHRAPQEALPTTPAATALLDQEVVPTAAEGGPDEPITVAHIVVEATSLAEDISHAPDLVGSGHIKEVIVAAEAEPGDVEMAEAPGSPNHQELGLLGEGEQAHVKLLVNKEGRYVCMLCHKTFKTGSILKAHMVTHSSRKDHECKLCGASFRTKGSLIRHHRRHTDERPYKCAKCGKSFRESGALTRHLKSLTPCTEKIRFSISKDTAVGKEEVPAGSSASTVGTVTSSVAGDPMETSPVIHLVTDAKGTVIHEVHVQMQELPLGMKALTPESPDSEELPCSSENSRENLLHQAMQNSGIVLERVAGEESALEPAPPSGSSPQCLGDGSPELPLLKVEQIETQVASEAATVPRTHPCPQCSETFPTAATLEAHKRGHIAPRPFTCTQCGKAFPKAYLLKKHQEVHVHERRFRCGDCGKLYKTIAHVRGHRRVHSDERPFPCPQCGKRYKTKNAQQVHFRTHLEEKPHVCQFCSRGFREKGSLVRHVRHHTGEKPFKCYKCGRGFAEHGTLNRHLRTKGGCLLEVEELLVSEESPSAAATVLAEDPHTVLVEFSSVVADTQEYIIEATADDTETSEATEIIEGTQTEVDSHIMKVVQQIVHQAGAGHQIIVQNVTMDQETALGSEATAADTITIATPESLTEQVAMTLASAISEGTVLTARAGPNSTEQATVTMVSSEDIEILEHGGELVIASPEGQLEVQTVIV
ncbi:transcription factor E4F1 isoform 1 [Mus musculus]|uniref:Transcription factor E4F1 n=1 Tax=Mus musculus TaxID=10090 RepID=E4F1_MOUSE|nr:transcription factor E4F1 isoform 1 [Mus musculus]Q8CCE9.2 RecName: Full=Transcription factor E4F1; AltName: Full=E4F transcription factor 1; AltName: Full=Putative E3 ubiquitin-protein ligase E4F1; AltName: Full=RING-type E3 ubiquitin transferase E4F1; AltName: Full=Transcription factor E4F; AltName: Full=Transcription factor phi AP3; AltName: Full=p120E4F [Mus musculus]|eukprot:NP_001288713.1 transcription factor E4F1 isoform 1 [Mus musculus]